MTKPNHRPFCQTLRFPRVILWALGGLLIMSVLAVRFIPMFAEVRMLVVVTILFALFSGLYFLGRLIARRRIVLVPVVLIVALLVLVWPVIGSGPVDVDSLRNEYQRQLGGFVGAPYVWGGETRWGVDCSGLARTALWQAMLREGMRTGNPRLLGRTLWGFWWRDVSASDLSDSRFGYTRVIGSAKKLAGYDTSKLKVGDIAVAGRGHVLVYYGGGQWIEASPSDWLVVVNHAPADSKRGFFNTSVQFVRWWILDDQPKSR